jgi:hypothetical protein
MNEWKRMWKEAIMAYVIAISCSLPGRTWKITKILSGWLVCGFRCELRNS